MDSLNPSAQQNAVDMFYRLASLSMSHLFKAFPLSLALSNPSLHPKPKVSEQRCYPPPHSLLFTPPMCIPLPLSLLSPLLFLLLLPPLFFFRLLLLPSVVVFARSASSVTPIWELTQYPELFFVFLKPTLRFCFHGFYSTRFLVSYNVFLLVGVEGELFSEQRAFEGDDIGCAGVGERDSVWVDCPEGKRIYDW